MRNARRRRKSPDSRQAGAGVAAASALPGGLAEVYADAATLGELMGITPEHVRKLASTNVIPRADRERGGYPVLRALSAYIQHLRANRRPLDPYRISYQRERALKERLLRRKLEGELVPLATVARLLGDLAAALRDEIEAAPARLGPRLAAAHGADERTAVRLLEEAARELRERLAEAMERISRDFDRVPSRELYGEDVDPGRDPEEDAPA